MTNHPNRAKSYWTRCPRNFGNEYTVAIATTAADAEQYAAEGWDRTSREMALHDLSIRDNAATQYFVGVEIDGREVEDSRFDVARKIRRGEI